MSKKLLEHKTLSRAMRVSEFASIAGVSIRTAWTEISRRAIPSVTVGRRGRRILESDVAAYLDARRN